MTHITNWICHYDYFSQWPRTAQSGIIFVFSYEAIDMIFEHFGFRSCCCHPSKALSPQKHKSYFRIYRSAVSLSKIMYSSLLHFIALSKAGRISHRSVAIIQFKSFVDRWTTIIFDIDIGFIHCAFFIHPYRHVVCILCA